MGLVEHDPSSRALALEGCFRPVNFGAIRGRDLIVELQFESASTFPSEGARVRVRNHWK